MKEEINKKRRKCIESNLNPEMKQPRRQARTGTTAIPSNPMKAGKQAQGSKGKELTSESSRPPPIFLSPAPIYQEENERCVGCSPRWSYQFGNKIEGSSGGAGKIKPM
jgi:hypothetical protein